MVMLRSSYKNNDRGGMIVIKKKGWRLVVATACLLTILGGCGSKGEQAKEAPPVMAPSREAVAAPEVKTTAEPASAQAPAKKDDSGQVAVEVEGVKLTKAVLDGKLQKKLATLKDQIPAESLDQAKAEIRKGLVDEFVVRTLLNREIGNKKVAATDKEIADVMEEIKSQLPPGVTMEELLKKNMMDAPKMHEEIGFNIRINKLITQELGGKAKATDKEITDFYGKNRDKFKKPETVHARHILMAKAPEDTEKIKADKKAKAEELRKQLAGGADFADLAAKNSDCPSKQNGGDLGFFTRGQMVKPFEDAAFSQKNNEIGPVVETDFGFHIIQVLEHQSEQVTKLEGDVKKRIGAFLEQQKQQAAFDGLVKKLKSGANIVVYGK